jgi:hypothetical protein
MDMGRATLWPWCYIRYSLVVELLLLDLGSGCCWHDAVIQARQAPPAELCAAIIAGATLLCWAPPAPPQGAGSAERAQHAARAAADYQERFRELTASGFVSAAGSASADLVCHSWLRFLSRWMGALRASGLPDSDAALVRLHAAATFFIAATFQGLNNHGVHDMSAHLGAFLMPS